jgi:hypothetical protein
MATGAQPSSPPETVSLAPDGEERISERLRSRLGVSSVVLDASASLALLNGEPGADVVEGAMASDGAVISVVNWAEVLSKSVENGVPPESAKGWNARACSERCCASSR